MPLARLLMLACLAPLLLGAAPRPVPHRIVSASLCADELLVALADRDQIAVLTEWARDPSMTYYAARARTLPFTHRSAEEIMMRRPDLVIGAPGKTRAALGPLDASGVTFLDMPYADSFDGIVAAVRTVAAAIGHPERGDRLVARMRGQLAAIGPPPGRGRVAAYYQRAGYLTGTGTLIDEAMHRVGLVNLAARLGKPALAQLSLEELALARPDFVITDASDAPVTDRGAALLHHPLLAAAIPAGHRLSIPDTLTTCGGPGYPRAVALLAAQVRAADRR